jgi:hypothetical protein
MKKLFPILLLSLFSQTLLWGQDDDFLKFRPLEFVDTLHQPPNEKEDFDLLLTDEEIFLLIKNENYWESFIVGTFSWSYSLDTVFFTSDKKFMMLQVTHHYRWDITYFYLVDLCQKAIIQMDMQYGSRIREEDNDLGKEIENIFEFKSKISFDGTSLFINTDMFDFKEVYDFNGEQRVISRDTSIGNNPYDGEYHYINGNFVKAKTYINKNTFAHSVFEIGEKFSLTTECAFYFECDCCVEYLLFTSDSTFLSIVPCTEETSTSEGKYEVIDNVLYLHFSGVWKKRKQVSDEQDQPTDYFIGIRSSRPYSYTFLPDTCQGKFILTKHENTIEKMLRSTLPFHELIDNLKRMGLR